MMCDSHALDKSEQKSFNISRKQDNCNWHFVQLLRIIHIKKKQPVLNTCLKAWISFYFIFANSLLFFFCCDNCFALQFTAKAEKTLNVKQALALYKSKIKFSKYVDEVVIGSNPWSNGLMDTNVRFEFRDQGSIPRVSVGKSRIVLYINDELVRTLNFIE